MPQSKREKKSADNAFAMEQKRMEKVEKLEKENKQLKEENKALTTLKATIKKMKAENKELVNMAFDELDVSIQYREAKGIHAIISRQAKAEKLSVPLYVRKLVRSKFGFGG